MSKFKECKECASKLGSPILCDSCYHNRCEIDRLEKVSGEVVKDLKEVLDRLSNR